MSRKKGHRKNRRRRPSAPAVCSTCLAPADSTPGAHLRAFAAVMNSAAQSGSAAKIHFMSSRAAANHEGFVLRLRGGWVVRTPEGERFPHAADTDYDELDD